MRRPQRRLVSGVGAASLAIAACGDAPPDEPTEPWPRTEACEELEAWPDDWAALEVAALQRIAALRAEGADCRERGKWGPAAPLQRRTGLDCAARSHALDMATRGYFGRLDPEGADEHERVEAAGYTAAVLVQHLAAGPRDASTLVDQVWVPRAVPCASLVAGELAEVGLGHVGDVDDELGTYWVLLLASPG
jgi:uncharacterized protein YkwD